MHGNVNAVARLRIVCSMRRKSAKFTTRPWRSLRPPACACAHDEALQLLRDQGCRIKGKDIALIPNWLVEEGIRRAPSRITIYNRQGDEAMRLEGRNNYYGLGTDLIRTQDVRTGEIRPSVLQDVINAARVSDACPQIDFIASFALPSDVSTNTMYIACVKAQLENSIKPIFFTAAGREDIAVIHEMACGGGGRRGGSSAPNRSSSTTPSRRRR